MGILITAQVWLRIEETPNSAPAAFSYLSPQWCLQSSSRPRGHRGALHQKWRCQTVQFGQFWGGREEPGEMCKHSTATACWVRLRQSGSQVPSTNRLLFEWMSDIFDFYLGRRSEVKGPSFVPFLEVLVTQKWRAWCNHEFWLTNVPWNSGQIVNWCCRTQISCQNWPRRSFWGCVGLSLFGGMGYTKVGSERMT